MVKPDTTEKQENDKQKIPHTDNRGVGRVPGEGVEGGGQGGYTQVKSTGLLMGMSYGHAKLTGS